MASYPTQATHTALVGVARARAFACAMPASGSWSTMPITGVTQDRKHGQPRRLGVISP
jgi:hypothetical protein